MNTALSPIYSTMHSMLACTLTACICHEHCTVTDLQHDTLHAHMHLDSLYLS